jgi:squalene cyclase
MKNCKDTACTGAGLAEYDVMVTSLTELSFLGHGYTHRAGQFKKTVRKALDWLLSQQQSDGSIGKDSGRFWILNHATATQALCEAYAITRDSNLQSPAQRAVDFLISAKSPGSGWGFNVRDGKPNSLATGWAIL